MIYIIMSYDENIHGDNHKYEYVRDTEFVSIDINEVKEKFNRMKEKTFWNFCRPDVLRLHQYNNGYFEETIDEYIFS